IISLFKYNGIDTETGLYDIEDVNQDGSFDFEDQIVVKDVSRKYFGGITNTITFKGLALSFLWQYVKQDGPTPSTFISPGFMSNQPHNVLNAWKNPGDLTDSPKLSQSIGSYRNYRLS